MESSELQRVLQPFFEDLHRHPETALTEHRTTERLRAALEAAEITVLDSCLPTGLVAEIRGGRPGKTFGLRADIDALPVAEESGLPYASETAGKMHACGHDFHASAVLGAALLLQERRESLRGRVRVFFQPAEETDQGGLEMLRTGLMEGCGAFAAIHTYPGFPAGKVGIKEGPVMAAVDRFAAVIRGAGSHAAMPHRGVDPIPAAAAAVLALQTLVSRGRDPFRPAVLSVTHLEAGNTWNVIPETAYIEGTARTLHPDDRAMLREGFARVVTNAAEAMGCTAEITWSTGTSAVVNDPGMCALARETAEKLGLAVGVQEETMGAEDFARYGAFGPSVFIRVGTGGSYPAHHPKFTVDPAALAPAAEFCAALAEAWLDRASDEA